VRAVETAVSGCAGIILQFPLYGGIMGMMATSGLAKLLAAAAVTLSGPSTYLVFTFLSAGLINLFVPSGGGQWAIQGPIAIQAADQLGLSLSSAVMAVAYGDQWTNMLQPFWALPLLGLTGVRARDMMGYTAVIFLASGVWFVALLSIFG
jgi:short-chain fatty acids transporter